MKKTIVIAEAGVNHNGSIVLAKKLIDGAAIAGADYIKFQFFNTNNLTSKDTNKAEYQKRNEGRFSSQYEMLKKYELSLSDHHKLKKYAIKKNIKFLTSAFDVDGLKEIKKLKLDFIKIPSGEITNVPYLRKVGKFNMPTILSTGMSTLNEIQQAIKILLKSGLAKKKLTVLQCTSEYPTNLSASNMRVLITFKNKLNVNVGYSDHTLGFESSIIAVALGASIIEKHITTNKKLNGPDHIASMDLKDFKTFISMIRNAETALGDLEKKPSYNERKNIKTSRKKILAKKIIKKGQKFSDKNLITLRANKGIPSIQWDSIIGKKSKKNYKPFEPILSA